MARGQQKIQSQKKAQEREQERKRREGQPGQQKRVQACMTVQCQVCKQLFMGSVQETELRSHAENRHSKQTFEQCFANWRDQAARMQDVKAAGKS